MKSETNHARNQSFKTFMKRCHLAPLDYNEVAEEAAKVKDKPMLSEAAKRYIAARDALDEQLDEVGHEFG